MRNLRCALMAINPESLYLTHRHRMQRRDPLAQGIECGLRPIRQMQLAQDAADMVAHGALA